MNGESENLIVIWLHTYKPILTKILKQNFLDSGKMNVNYMFDLKDFQKKEEWYIENSTKEFRRHTPE